MKKDISKKHGDYKTFSSKPSCVPKDKLPFLVSLCSMATTC